MHSLAPVLAQVLPLVLILAVAGLWLWSGVWVGRDAARRSKPPTLVSFLVLLVGWPVSILVWIALRPENIRPRFDLNRFRVQ